MTVFLGQLVRIAAVATWSQSLTHSGQIYAQTSTIDILKWNVQAHAHMRSPIIKWIEEQSKAQVISALRLSIACSDAHSGTLPFRQWDVYRIARLNYSPFCCLSIKKKCEKYPPLMLSITYSNCVQLAVYFLTVLLRSKCRRRHEFDPHTHIICIIPLYTIILRTCYIVKLICFC